MTKSIAELAKEYTSVEDVKKALRSIQSKKSRLLKQKSKEDYETQWQAVVLKEQQLKEVRAYLEPKAMTVTTMTKEDIALLNYEETIRAVKSIQSKKCLVQFDDPDAYEQACKIEEWLKEHRANIKPIEETVVKKSSINDLINHVETLDQQVDKDYILEQLRKLL